MTDTARKPGQPYAIAAYLPAAAIAAALAHTYDQATTITAQPRDNELCCPLGRAIQALGYFPPEATAVVPQASHVARALYGAGVVADEDGPAFQVVWDAARAFIDDWDAGLITDLPAALGLGQQALPVLVRRAS